MFSLCGVCGAQAVMSLSSSLCVALFGRTPVGAVPRGAVGGVERPTHFHSQSFASLRGLSAHTHTHVRSLHDHSHDSALFTVTIQRAFSLFHRSQNKGVSLSSVK